MALSSGAAVAVGDESVSATGGRAAGLLGQVSWALFEWARNPYVLLITIYVYAPYFSERLVGDKVAGQALWGQLSSLSGFAIALLAPFLGAVADLGGRRKPWIVGFASVLAISSYALWFAVPGEAMMPLVMTGVCLVAAGIAFEFTAVFHNAMLPEICSHRRVGSISGLGLALGNLAGLIIMLGMIFAFMLPGQVDWPFIPATPLFGIDAATYEHERISGPISAIWLVVFTLPLLLFTPDRAPTGISIVSLMGKGVGRVLKTVGSLRHYKNVAIYLIARMFYNDGKTAILVFGGIYAAGTFGWGPLDMLAYGIILSVFAVFGGVFGGWLDNNLGSQRAILVSISGTAIGLILMLQVGPTNLFGIWRYTPETVPLLYHGPFFNTVPEATFVTIVIIVAIFITAAYANSRTMLARIAPTEKMTEFFGLYALSGTATAFMAPFVNSVATTWFKSQAAGMYSILLFLGIGLAMMLFVKDERAVTRPD
ncbi:MAG: MFS transporter [Alphaproteobacteria bacterium]|nr:MFS transporter [Alphaproteobacteria bacterium]